MSLHRKERPKQSDIQCCKDEIASLTAFARNDTGWNIKSITSFVLSNLIFIFCVATLFVHCSLTFMLHAQEGKKKEKELIMGIARNPLISATSVLGKGTADARELFESAAEEFKKRHGITLTMKIYPAPKFLFKAFQDKILDFSALTLATYLYAKNNNIPVKPLLTVSATGAKGEKYCIYAHKSSGIKNVKQLEGKRFVTGIPSFLSKKDMLPPKESYIYWILLKKILSQAGIHKPFAGFFKEFRVLPTPAESLAYGVLLKNFDALIINASYLPLLIDYDKGFLELVSVSCIDVPALPPLVYRKDVKPEIVKFLKDFALHPPETKQAKKVLKEFKNYKILTVDEKDYDIYFKWLKEAEQKGWLKEFDEIMKNTPRPKMKKGGE